MCANNENKTLHTVFSSGIFRKKDSAQTYHTSLEQAKTHEENNFVCELLNLEKLLKESIQKRISKRGRFNG